MPAVHTATFRVRHYECDGYGHLNNVNYVRYMQEAALEASAAVDWDWAHHDQIGHHWLIRETDIEYFLPFVYGDTVEIKTWADDFRRVRSRRVYEFRKPGSDALHARAETEWVFINTQTQQLATIPPEIIQAFAPDGDAKNGVQRAKFPEPPPPPEEVFTLRKRIEWRDIDTEGHANNAAYFSLIEDTSTQVGRHYGWGMPRMVQMGMVMVMRRLRVVYVQPALMDDDVEISAYLSDYRRISAIRHYTIWRVGDGALLARARALWVCFDLNKQRPTRIPDEMAHDFAPNIVLEKNDSV